MRALILLLVVACALPSCMTTHGCVGRAEHNKKVSMKRHHYRKTHHTYSRAVSY
jgi:hypothetical protein